MSASTNGPEEGLSADVPVEISEPRPRVTFAKSPLRSPQGQYATLEKPPSASSGPSPTFTSVVNATTGPSVASGPAGSLLINTTADSHATMYPSSSAVKQESDFRRRWRATPKRTVCISFTLLAAGIAFLVVGLACVGACTQSSRGFALFGVGAVLMLPGIYSAFVLISYWRGRIGYSPDQLPQFD
eukprot:RCo011288